MSLRRDSLSSNKDQKSVSGIRPETDFSLPALILLCFITSVAFDVMDFPFSNDNHFGHACALESDVQRKITPLHVYYSIAGESKTHDKASQKNEWALHLFKGPILKLGAVKGAGDGSAPFRSRSDPVVKYPR